MAKKRSKISEDAQWEQFADLFAAVGDALTCWVAVEDAAFLAFAAIIEAKHPEAVSAAFHALSTFNPNIYRIGLRAASSDQAARMTLQRDPASARSRNRSG